MPSKSVMSFDECLKESSRAHRRVAKLSKWPPGNQPAATTFPDWPDQYIGWMWNRGRRELGHVNAFYRVPIINAALRALQTDLCSVPLKVYRGRGDKQVEIEPAGKLVDDGGNLADLLKMANPLDTGRQIMAGLVGSMVLTGDGYWFLEFFRGPSRPPSEIRNMPGHLVRVVPGKKRTEQGFEFNPAGAGAWRPVAGENVIHFRRFNPDDKPVGVSDIEAVKDTYEAEYFALIWVREFFRHGGIFPGIWTTDDNDSMRLGDEKLKELGRRLRDRQSVIDAGDTGQAFLPIIVEGLKYVAQGMKLSEMEIEKQLSVIDKKILAAIGIPPWRLGIQEQGSLGGTGSQTDLSIYWLSTVAGNLDEIMDVLNERLAPYFGKDIHVEADLTAVPAVQQLLLDQAKAHFELTGKKPVESQNDARRVMGLTPDADPESDSIRPEQFIGSPFGKPGTGGGAPDFGTEGAPADTPASPKKKPAGKGNKARNQLAARTGEPEPVRLSRDELRTKAAFSLERFRGRFEGFVLERLAGQHAIARERLVKTWEGPTGTLSNAGGRSVKLAFDVSNLMDEANPDDEARASKLLAELLKARGIDAVRDLEAAAGVALEVQMDLEATNWAEFLRSQAERVIRLPDATTRRFLRDSMAEGLAAGEDLTQMLARLDAVFEGRRNNAMTIARTETQPAYNFAAMETWKQSGVVDSHEWLTSHSGTGGRHAENPYGKYDGLDGQVRALGEHFDVGGTPLLYPGDPAGPVGELANCVCTTRPILSEVTLAARRMGVYLRNGHANGNGNGKAKNRIREYLRGRAA